MSERVEGVKENEELKIFLATARHSMPRKCPVKFINYDFNFTSNL